LARYFNKLIATLRVPISEAKTTVDHLVSISEELSSINRQLDAGEVDGANDVSEVAKESSPEILRIGICVLELSVMAKQLRQTMDKFKV